MASAVEEIRSPGTVRTRSKKEGQQLRAARRAARLADSFSHDFRTPLTVIKEYAALLRDGVAGPLHSEQARLLDVIDDRVEDLNNLVHDMQNASRLHGGLLVAWRRVWRVNEFIVDAFPALQRKARVRGVSLDLTLDEDLPQVFCDYDQARRILNNLTVQAIRLCPEGGTVCISATEDSRSSDVVIGVSSKRSLTRGESPGLELDFPRLQGSTAKGSSDQKLTFSQRLVRELIDLNFGQLESETNKGIPGEGAAFTFTLPLAKPVEVVRRHLTRLRRRRKRVTEIALASAAIGVSDDGRISNDVEAFLSTVVRSTDLIVQTADDRWMLVLGVGEAGLERFFSKARKRRREVNIKRGHDPLPEIEYRTQGTWCIAHEQQELLRCLRRLLNTPETGSV